MPLVSLVLVMEGTLAWSPGGSPEGIDKPEIPAAEIVRMGEIFKSAVITEFNKIFSRKMVQMFMEKQ